MLGMLSWNAQATSRVNSPRNNSLVWKNKKEKGERERSAHRFTFISQCLVRWSEELSEVQRNCNFSCYHTWTLWRFYENHSALINGLLIKQFLTLSSRNTVGDVSLRFSGNGNIYFYYFGDFMTPSWCLRLFYFMRWNSLRLKRSAWIMRLSRLINEWEIIKRNCKQHDKRARRGVKSQ